MNTINMGAMLMSKGGPHAETLACASQPSRRPGLLVSSRRGPAAQTRWHVAPRHARRYDFFGDVLV